MGWSGSASARQASAQNAAFVIRLLQTHRGSRSRRRMLRDPRRVGGSNGMTEPRSRGSLGRTKRRAAWRS
jgi:hypothetical protein